MTKEPDKSIWEGYYNNKSVSGIEVKDKNGRITINLNENSEPLLPPSQTFEEMIQAKRRQQMLLYGSGSTSSNAILSERAARRVAAAARQQAVNSNLNNRRPTTSSNLTGLSRSRQPAAARMTKKSKKAPRPTPLEPSKANSADSDTSFLQPPAAVGTPLTQIPTATTSTHATKKTSISALPPRGTSTPTEPLPGTSKQVVTSLKDLNKLNPLFKSVDQKEVKLLLKSAPPGSSIILPNGAVFKKSRRGGARVGAGRKRSRPLPPGQPQAASTSRQSNGVNQSSTSVTSNSSNNTSSGNNNLDNTSISVSSQA